MNNIDHFTIPLPSLGYIVSFLRIDDRIGWHGSQMERSATGFEAKGGEKGDWVTLTDPHDSDQVREGCETLAIQAAAALTTAKYGEPRDDEEDALRGTLLNAIRTRTWKQQ